MSRILRKDVLSSLIQSSYLPAEIPPAVTARHFAKHCKDNFNNLKSTASTTFERSITHFDSFNVPRENSSRRDLALVHPAAQLRLSMVLTEKHKEIRKIIGDMRISLYDPSPDMSNKKAFKGISFKYLDAKRNDIAKKKCHILCADISRFFYTIYTHSIPWAVLGKDKVKDLVLSSKGKKKKRKLHWTEQIDSALQACQSRETFGIPVGPDTSRIVAEILLSGIHKDEEFSSNISGSPGIRLVDDFFLGFDTQAESLAALTSLRNALGAYNLQLNDEKTQIKSSRDVFMDRWRYELLEKNINYLDRQQQMRDIRNLAELALYHASIVGNAHPVKWVSTRLLNTRIHDDNFASVLTILLRFGRDFPLCISQVSAFIINNKSKCTGQKASKIIQEWIKVIFHMHAKNSHDFEVSWGLIVCGALNFPVAKADLSAYHSSECSAVFAILGLLKDRGLLTDPLANFGWRQIVKKSGPNGHHWLMYYESVLRGWTKDKQMINAVNNDAFLKNLLSNGISFLDQTIFDNVNINLEKRTMKRVSKYVSSRKDLDEDELFGFGSL